MSNKKFLATPAMLGFASLQSRQNKRRTTGVSISLATDIVSDVEALARLASEWDSLLDDSRSRVFFLRHHWNLLWWRHFAPQGSRLYVVTCRDNVGRLVGVAPLYWKRRSALGVPYLRELSFLGLGIELKTSEYIDLVARRGQEKEVAAAIANRLLETEGWDRLFLPQAPNGSVATRELAAVFNGRSTVVDCDTAPYVDTSESWQAFKRTLGRSMRRNVEYYPRRLRRFFDYAFQQVGTAEQLDRALDALVRLHQARWLAKGEPGAFNRGALTSFLREAAHEALRHGRLRLWTLSFDGEIQAALVGFLDAGVLHYFQKGFNPAFERHELGNVMLALCIRACCDDECIERFDFMGGGAAYKMLWGRQVRNTYVVEVRQRNLRTSFHEVHVRFRDGALRLLRAATPLSLRVARRDLLRRRMLGAWTSGLLSGTAVLDELLFLAGFY